jgi:glycosyltransferase involved in cell wall biosynthesis
MKNTKPEVSVILPVYNGGKFLDETINAVLNQTFRNFEFIIINDKSTDNSLNILKKYAKKDKRIVVLNNKKNMHCLYSRNRAARIAKGKYIAILDADDVCLPERLEIQLNYLEKHPDIFMIGGSAIVIDEEGNKLGVFRKYEDYKKMKRKLPRVNCMLHPSIMYRNTREFFYRELPLSGDYDFILRVLSAGKKIENIPEFLIKYRVNQSSNTFTINNPAFFFQKVREFYAQRIKTGKDDYETLKSPNIPIPIDPKKSELSIKIIAGFQDGQNKKTRKKIKKYFKHHGISPVFLGYYILSFFPQNFYWFLRKKFDFF